MTETQDSVYWFSHTSILTKGQDLTLSEWSEEFDKASSPDSDVTNVDVLLSVGIHTSVLS